jgi:hypothetical protein
VLRLQASDEVDDKVVLVQVLEAVHSELLVLDFVLVGLVYVLRERLPSFLRYQPSDLSVTGVARLFPCISVPVLSHSQAL